MGPKMYLCHFYKKTALRIWFQLLLNDAQYWYKPFSEDGMSKKTPLALKTGDLCPGVLMILNELQLPRLFLNFDFFFNFFLNFELKLRSVQSLNKSLHSVRPVTWCGMGDSNRIGLVVLVLL